MMAPTEEKQHSVHSAANHPLALAQLAAQLGNQHQVRGYDPDMDPGYPGSMTTLIKEFNPEIIGINFRIFDTTLSYEPRSYLPRLEKALIKIRRLAPKAIILLGGSAYSFFPKILLERLPMVDVGFFLDADISFPAFVDNPVPGPDIKGLYYREKGKIVSTAVGLIPPLDELLAPDFDLIPLKPYEKQGRAAVGLESKRGCRLSCVPCIYPFLTGSKTLAKSPQRVVGEVEELARRDVSTFFFLDSIFNLPNNHGIEVCRGLKEAKLPVKWGAFLTAAKFDDDMAKQYYEAGCRLYYFAPDGISDQSIKTWKRPITKEKQKQAIRIVRKRADNHLHVSFLIGAPGEGWKDIWEFAGFLFFLALQKAFSISMSFTRIYPNTKIREIAIAEGVILEKDTLIEPKFYMPYPSSMLRFIFHPLYRAVHFAARVIRRIISLFD